MAAKPWDDVLIKIWNFLTKGYRRYITIPIFLIFVAAAIISTFKDNVETIMDSEEESTDEKNQKNDTAYTTNSDEDTLINVEQSNTASTDQKSYPTSSEYDVFGEWVLKLLTTDDKATAQRERDNFHDIYLSNYDSLYKIKTTVSLRESFHVIRSLDTINEWWIVIDQRDEISSYNSLEEMSQDLLETQDVTVQSGDNLFFFLDNEGEPKLYERDRFEELYGEIKK